MEAISDDTMKYINERISYGHRKPPIIPHNLDFEFNQSPNFRIRISQTGNDLDLGSRNYLLSMDTGVVKSLFDVLFIILSDNSIFQGYGESSHIVNVPTFDVPDWNSLDIAIENNVVIPNLTKTRMLLHKSLFHTCIGLLVGHELTHIQSGHIPYLFYNGLTAYEEGSANNLAPIDTQTLEMDADAGSVGEQLKFLLEKAKLNPDDIFSSTEYIFKSLSFCISVILTCHRFNPLLSNDDLQKLFYPSIFHRLSMMNSTMEAVIAKYVPEHYHLFQNQFNSALHEFKIIISRGLVSKQKLVLDVTNSNIGEGRSYLSKLLQNWHKWHPILEPYAFIKLAPLQ